MCFQNSIVGRSVLVGIEHTYFTDISCESQISLSASKKYILIAHRVGIGRGVVLDNRGVSGGSISSKISPYFQYFFFLVIIAFLKKICYLFGRGFYCCRNF